MGEKEKQPRGGLSLGHTLTIQEALLKDARHDVVHRNVGRRRHQNVRGKVLCKKKQNKSADEKGSVARGVAGVQ